MSNLLLSFELRKKVSYRCLNIKYYDICKKLQYLVESMCPISDPEFADDGGTNADYDDLASIKKNSPLDLYSILIRYCLNH